MEILQYNDLETSRVGDSLDRVVGHLRAGDFRAAEVKKLSGTPLYRAKLDGATRRLELPAFETGDFVFALEQEKDDAALQHAIRYIRLLHSRLAGNSGAGTQP